MIPILIFVGGACFGGVATFCALALIALADK